MPIAQLAEYLTKYPKLLVLTGAGVSAASGIPTYRDHNGQWQSVTPIQHQEFLEFESTRQLYWARSAVGWPVMEKATPSLSHRILKQMEDLGSITQLITQNVDGLHQKAGHRNVIDLHGRVDQVICLNCHKHESRTDVQSRLINTNPFITNFEFRPAPDGDAHLNSDRVAQIALPMCLHCGGTLKPDVVFFGGNVAQSTVDSSTQAVLDSDALLVVGSSLTVYSGFRFCKQAIKANKPVFIINQGQTRADEIATLKISSESGYILSSLLQRLHPL